MKYLKYLAIVLLVVIIVLGSARLVVFNKDLHTSLFIKSKTVISDYDSLNNEVIDYLKGDRESISSDMFSEKEKDHLRDVKWLINVLIVVFYASILMFLFLLYYLKDYSSILFYGGISTLIVMSIVGLISVISFDFAFELFHKIFFPQGNYIFRTNLPKLYNSTWYALISLRIFIYSVITSLILIVQKYVLPKQI